MTCPPDRPRAARDPGSATVAHVTTVGLLTLLLHRADLSTVLAGL
ncbi:hypothetical protein ACFZCU_27790 [Streptomyces canus]